MNDEKCPCGLDLPLDECCRPFLDGNDFPLTPEALMRSRYTAYQKNRVDYIVKTMKGKALSRFDAQKTKQRNATIKWFRLDILMSEEKGLEGCVEFIAHYQVGGKHLALHEVSQFQKEGKQWFYVDGTVQHLTL